MITKTIFRFMVVLIILMRISIGEAEERSSSTGELYPNTQTNVLLGTVLTQRGSISKWTDDTLFEAFQRSKEGGIGVAIWTNDWGTIETSLGKYDWAFLDYITDKTKQHGLKFSLSLEIAHIAKKGNYPKGIVFKRFDESNFVYRFKAFINKLLNRYKGKIHYLWIGQEVDYYLHNHPNQKVPFLNFFQEVKKEIKLVAPEVIVGIVGSYHLAREFKETTLLQDFSKESDLMALTLYMEADQANPKVSDTESYFNRLLDLFPSKRIAIHETAWSSRGPKGSEQNQREYVSELAKVVRKHADRFEFVSWYMLHDFSETDSRNAAVGYGMGKDKKFIDWQGSLGLLKNDGSEKPAWRTWKEYMKGK